ncbi:tetratricopeptide repeat protein, partial [Hymenobacter sediminis]|uniref:tetratricopeptide repeat protein n=1 Tax=Hymenobacter sediminis TaxID=2218621 RepID=UPI000F502920
KNASTDKKPSTDLYLSLANVYRDKARQPNNGASRQADVTNSLNLYHEALRLEPNLANAHANLGHLYKDLGDLPAAEKELRTAVALKKDYPY